MKSAHLLLYKLFSISLSFSSLVFANNLTLSTIEPGTICSLNPILDSEIKFCGLYSAIDLPDSAAQTYQAIINL